MSHFRDYFQYKDGELSAQGVPLSKIAAEVGTPVYIYSSEALLAPVHTLQKALAGLDHLICFAVKSNSNISVLKLLSEAGTGMDLVSGGELYRASQAGVSAKKIVFSGVGKTSDEIEMALNYQGTGIYSFHVESASELQLIQSVAQRKGRIAPVALRFNPDVDPKTHPYISTGLKKNKFGLSRKEILTLLSQLPELSSVQLKGISIHIGSQLLSLSPLKDAFEKLDQLLAEIAPRLSNPLEFVDVGGGVGIAYKNEKTPSLEKYGQLIQKYFGKKSRHSGSLKVLLEPGRVIAGNSGLLLTQVLHRKKTVSKDFIVVDAGMNDLIRPALYQSHHEIIPVRESLLKKKLSQTTIVGPVCESSDCFGDRRRLSESLKSGDLLALMSAGAYGFSMASHYNSRPRPPEVLISNGSYQMIRRRESYSDLVAAELF
jgi:diaminopimelate decarboxylase